MVNKDDKFFIKSLVASVVFIFFACGTEKITEKMVPVPAPIPVPPGGGGGELSFSADVKPILNANCALSGCHANAAFLATESAFLNSKGPQRITNSSMPPSYSPKYGQWTQQDKNTILAWFDANF